MRFGSFNYPDFFEFNDGRALCKDCESAAQNLELRGPFKLNSVSSESPIPAVEGELINRIDAEAIILKNMEWEEKMNTLFSELVLKDEL